MWAHPVAAEGAATVPAAEATIVISLRPVVLAVRDGDRLFPEVALRNKHLTLETNGETTEFQNYSELPLSDACNPGDQLHGLSWTQRRTGSAGVG